MIEYEKEAYGWKFIFLGTNIDAVQEANYIGIQADRSVTFANDSDKLPPCPTGQFNNKKGDIYEVKRKWY